MTCTAPHPHSSVPFWMKIAYAAGGFCGALVCELAARLTAHACCCGFGPAGPRLAQRRHSPAPWAAKFLQFHDPAISLMLCWSRCRPRPLAACREGHVRDPERDTAEAALCRPADCALSSKASRPWNNQLGVCQVVRRSLAHEATHVQPPELHTAYSKFIPAQCTEFRVTCITNVTSLAHPCRKGGKIEGRSWWLAQIYSV